MLRTVLYIGLLFATGWLLVPTALAAQGDEFLNSLPQPVFASINDNGVVVTATTKFVSKVVRQLTTRVNTREIVVDGQTHQQSYEVTVPVSAYVTAHQPVIHTWSQDNLQVREVSGKEISYEELSKRLQQATLALFAAQEPSPNQLTAFKPETLLLIARDPNTVQHFPMSAVAPTPQLDGAAAPPDSAAPTVRRAYVQNGMLTLHIQVRTRMTTTVYRQSMNEGDTQKELVPIELATAFQSGQRMPFSAVEVYNAQGEALDAAQAAAALSTERCVLVSTDGGKVDPAYLQIVRPDALVVVPPITYPSALPQSPLPPDSL